MAEYNEELLRYIKEQLKAGFSVGEIKNIALQQGWSEPELNDTIIEAQVQSEEKEKEPEEEKVERKKAKTGFAVSLIGGLLIIIDSAFAILMENFTPLFAVQSIYPLYMLFTINTANMIGIIFGLLVVIASALLLRGRTKAGGIIAILFSVLVMVFVSINLGSLVGLTGGIVGLTKK